MIKVYTLMGAVVSISNQTEMQFGLKNTEEALFLFSHLNWITGNAH